MRVCGKEKKGGEGGGGGLLADKYVREIPDVT